MLKVNNRVSNIVVLSTITNIMYMEEKSTVLFDGTFITVQNIFYKRLLCIRWNMGITLQ